MIKRYVPVIVVVIFMTLGIDIHAMGIESDNWAELGDDVGLDVSVARSNVGSERRPESRVLVGNGQAINDYSKDKKELNALMDQAVVYSASVGFIVAMFLIWLGR